ncbi:DeoR/GlpR family DNA-binding transcription regulator [Flavihumibacter rivuli]|uniref:DeoR/GlpR family DNA-binding transcription regulator n=1 Tax=Flavihumibacter rivuli TaxID=2838156 RepID=UPI001BDEE8F3|nr:DeoR/GlpR family DNA-binding transcription regulator [Flavihumibacter rivuli]ULQ57672.1 DeoR/GlpR family DNA-binding transcription regulator [Flavihumibacter rivuli]
MLKKERQAYILHKVNLHNKVLSAQLCEEINVSEDTIRRDLQELADQGKLIKVHGGALSHSFSQVNFTSSQVYSLENKVSIARKAASLIKDGMFVLTSGGTTIMELAKALPPGLKATFISGSIPTVLEYMNHPNIDVIVIGDKVSKSSRITVGAEAINQIKRIKADLCFLGINAIDLKHGVTDNDWEVVMIKRAMIESSQKVIGLTIAEKMDTFQPLHICDLKEVDMLITELNPRDERLLPYHQAGIQIL